jgi:hypothetical protein
MPVLRSKLHTLNRKLHEASALCTEKLWGKSEKLEVTLSIVCRSRLYALEQYIREIREACKEDKGL